MRYLFILVLLCVGCQASAPPPPVCQPSRCLPDEHFDVVHCTCVLNDDAHLE